MEVIESIRRVRGKVYITIGSEEIVIPLRLFRERPLEEGEEIDPEEYDHWLLLHQYRPALERAVELLAARAHSRREIEQKLRRSGYRPSTIEMVLYKLERERLLDDADFARQWVESRANRKLGRRRIQQELRHKGVSAEEAEAALEDIDEEDQLSAAVSLAEKAAARVRPGEDPRKAAQRITGMLIRRGFGWDVAREALQQVMRGLDEM